MPLSFDGEDGLRGLLLYVIDHKVCAVFRPRGKSAGLGCILRGKHGDGEKQPKAQDRKQHKE